MGKVILVGATKGGVGKSVSSYNLAYSLASLGKKVLAVDFDSQANLTTCFGVEDTATVPVTIGHLMMVQMEDEKLPDPAEYIMNRNGVDFIPSSMFLSEVDAKLRLEMGAERMLANIIEPLRDSYDYLIIDTCPAFYQIMETRLETQTVEELAELFSAVEVDFENNILISMRFQDSSVIVHKRRLPVFTLGLNDRLNDTTNDLLEEKVITCSTFKFLGSYTPYGDFLDGHDGYWYGFANQANSSGDAKMYWAKIKKDDYTMTEGIWTLSNCYLKAIGYFKVDTYAQRGVRGVIRNGYLYLTANNDEGIYKINLSNSTDVTLIPFGFTSEGKSQTGSGTCANYLFMVNDLIIGWDYQIKPDDTVVQTVGSTRLLNLGTPLFQYKEFCFGWGGNYGSDYRMCFLLTPYLASINNLSTAVVKTTDKTMKITYELTEVDS